MTVVPELKIKEMVGVNQHQVTIGLGNGENQHEEVISTNSILTSLHTLIQNQTQDASVFVTNS